MILTFILNLIGYWMIFYAIEYKRGEESRIKNFSKDYWVVVILVVLASYLFSI